MLKMDVHAARYPLKSRVNVWSTFPHVHVCFVLCMITQRDDSVPWLEVLSSGQAIQDILEKSVRRILISSFGAYIQEILNQ